MDSRVSGHRLCVAPMMDCTDRHDRFFLRLMSRRTLLYTEMITTGALLHGDRERFLRHHPSESPVALQLGGSEPRDLAACAALGAAAEFDEVNLNVGCPSPRVSSGRFGACLMTEPTLVAECVQAMGEAVAVPVTVKTRIGVDNHDHYSHLLNFVETVARAGCHRFIIHARKAWLEGLSPKQNREIPELKYETVHRLKADFPHLTIVINGGITRWSQVREQLHHVDGVMVGREAYKNPYWLATADRELYADPTPIATRCDIVNQLIPYVEQELAQGTRLAKMTRHIIGLYQGQPGGRRWRRYLSENAHRPGAGVDVIRTALHEVERYRGQPARA